MMFVMDLIEIPKNVENWSINIIDSLLNISSLESDEIECKREMTPDLPKAICAMANTSGGFIIIGLDEEKPGFQKRGLSDIDEDTIRQAIGNARFSIEPIPKVSINCITEQDKIYPIIQIHEEISKKPFFVKNTGICYIRIDNSSRHASRDTIMKLFSSLDLKKEVIYLRASFVMLKHNLAGTMKYIKSISPRDMTRPLTIDVSFLRNAIMRNQSFLIENDLFGEITENTRKIGAITILETLDKLNTKIDEYNLSSNADIAIRIKDQMTNPIHSLAPEILEIPKFIDKLISKCDENINAYG